MNELEQLYKQLRKDDIKDYDYLIFCDGSANWKTRLGGFGILILDTKEKQLYKYRRFFSETSIGRMELAGIIFSMFLVEDKTAKIKIFCDSQYAVNTCTTWLKSWIRDGILESKKNLDILKILRDELPKFSYLHFNWVKGHNGYIGNEIADKLASGKDLENIERLIDTKNLRDFLEDF